MVDKLMRKTSMSRATRATKRKSKSYIRPGKHSKLVSKHPDWARLNPFVALAVDAKGNLYALRADGEVYRSKPESDDTFSSWEQVVAEP